MEQPSPPEGCSTGGDGVGGVGGRGVTDGGLGEGGASWPNRKDPSPGKATKTQALANAT
ncbi:hypothetical protein MPNT_420001 [Candidatus Methylacidithermus pantelleriae]|uniref:Uncharacterized protein n=1 Tax=Candidatus Methylacidithermus pantelleriae TaxID=2744239 RepID=A0A8J2BRJ7_9BACT|nr:hypothetical protein MPNT_420001 [Candidatus Methylacidithermus pantelleriae]